MNNLFKKSVAVIASMGVLATTVNVNAFAASIVNAEFTAAYEWMKEAKATTMPTEEAFLPYNNVTREQAPKMMINGLMAGGVELKKVRDYNLDFSDLTSADPSLQADIIKGYEYGLVNGWNGEYHPRDVVNRAQVMTILGRALYGQLPESAEYWKNYYKLLNTEGIFTIENAQAPIKRYELALVLYRVANLDRTANNETVDQLLCEVLGKEDCKKDDANTPEVVKGDVTVSVSTKTPNRQYVAANQKGVRVMAIDVKAGNEKAALEKLTVHLEGVANYDQIENLFLYDEDGNQLDKTAVRSNYQAQFRIKKDAFVVPAKNVKTLYIGADIESFSGTTTNDPKDGVFYLSIDANDVEATGKVGGVFPINSNDVIIVAKKSDLNVEVSPISAGSEKSIKVGETNKEIASFTLKNSSKRELVLHSMKFLSDEPNYRAYLEGVINNVKVYADGKDITKNVVIDRDQLTITTDDFTFNKNVSVKIVADIIGGREKDKLSLVIDESNDVVISEKRNGSSVSIVKNSAGVVVDNLLISKMQIVEVNNLLQRASSSPKSAYVARGQENVLLLEANLNLKRAVDLKEVKVGVTVNGSKFEDLELMIDDASYTVKANQITSATYDVRADQYLEAGTHKIQVYVDVDSDAVADNDIQVTIDGATFDGRYPDSRDTLTVNGVAMGAKMTVKDASVSLSPTAVATKNDIIMGAQEVDVIGFTIQPSNITDAKVQSFDVVVDQNGVGADVTYTLSAEIASGVVYSDTKKCAANASDCTFTFNGIDTNIAKDQKLNGKIRLASVPTSNDLVNKTVKFTLNNVKVWDNNNGNSINPTTSISKEYTVKANATISDGSVSVRNEAIVADVANQVLGVYNIKPTNDSVKVETLLFELTPTGTMNGDDMKPSDVVNAYYLKVGDKVIETQGAALEEGNKYYVYFDLNVIKPLLNKDQYTQVQLLVNTRDFDEPTAAATLKADIVKEIAPSSVYNTRIVAATANTTNAVAVTTIDGQTHDVRALSVAIAGDSKTVALQNGAVVYRFSLTAKGGDVKVSKFDFELTKIALSGDDTKFELYDVADDSTTHELADDGSLTHNFTINDGDTKTFEIKVADLAVNTNSNLLPQVVTSLTDTNASVTWGSTTAQSYNGKDITGIKNAPTWTAKLGG